MGKYADSSNPLVFKDKVGIAQVRMGKQVHRIWNFSLYCPAPTLLVMQHEGYWACKKAGCSFDCGDNLTAALHGLQLQLSPTPPVYLAPIKSRMETFWYHLSQVHLKKMAVKMERHRRPEENIWSYNRKQAKNEQKLISDTKHEHKTGYWNQFKNQKQMQTSQNEKVNVYCKPAFPSNDLDL